MTSLANVTEKGAQHFRLPRWGFNSTCDWQTVAEVDLALCCVAILYNATLTLLPLFASRMYRMQGALISSYACAAFLVSVYFVLFDSRFLGSAKHVLGNERPVPYLLMRFLNYLCMLHMHLLSWDQHHSVTHFNAHRRFLLGYKFVKLEIIVWISAIVICSVEGVFICNPLGYETTGLHHATGFRLIINFLLMAFFWIGPLVLITHWNAMLFSFLLKVSHNGYEIKTSPESPERNEQTMSEYLSQSRRRRNDTEFIDPAEYATLPDDCKQQLSQSFVNLMMVTSFATIMLLWCSYHLLAIFCITSNRVLNHNSFLKIFYQCGLYISLYTVTKCVLLLNPFWCSYYWKEMQNICGVRKFGVTHE